MCESAGLLAFSTKISYQTSFSEGKPRFQIFELNPKQDKQASKSSEKIYHLRSVKLSFIAIKRILDASLSASLTKKIFLPWQAKKN